MKNCAVCGKENKGTVCRVCGFDESCFYEAFPTIDILPAGISSVQCRKAAYARKDRNLLRCQSCGGTTFEFLTSEKMIRCTTCGTGMSLARLNSLANMTYHGMNWLKCDNPKNCLSAGADHSVVLRSDGTVYVAGNVEYQAEVQQWRDIVCVAAGDGFTAALHKNGTVQVSGYLYEYEAERVCQWKEIARISAQGNTLIGLREDGTAVSTRHDLRHWENLKAVTVGYDCAFGVQNNGTILSTSNNMFWQCDLSRWNDIVDVSAGYYHVVGLKKDGTVVADGYNVYGQCDVSKWKDIVAISAGPLYTLGVRKDGTVLATLSKPAEKMKAANWKNIIAVSAGANHIVGLDRTGVFWAVGDNKNRECDVNKLKY